MRYYIERVAFVVLLVLLVLLVYVFGNGITSHPKQVEILGSCPSGMTARNVESVSTSNVWLQCFSSKAEIRGPLVLIFRPEANKTNFYTASQAYRRPGGTLIIYQWEPGYHKVALTSTRRPFYEECILHYSGVYHPASPQCARVFRAQEKAGWIRLGTGWK